MKTKGKNQVTLKQWIASRGGTTEVSKLLKVQPAALRVWLRGQGSPTLATAARVVKISGGLVSYETIFKESTRCIGKKSKAKKAKGARA